MQGGFGADRYTVDSLLDFIIELPGEGNDTVVTPFSTTLGADLEGLILTGTADLLGTGNALANRITGNAGNNLLRGLDGNDVLLGGDGADTLVGGAGADNLTAGNGADWFLFENSTQGQDRITDFALGVDKVAVQGAGFGGLAPGALSAASFVAHASNATTAPGGTPQFIYNTSTGVLRFDADGVGGLGSVAIVVFTGLPTLSAADIVVA
jgi:Ca2+-binding RTX toxin-like protein